MVQSYKIFIKHLPVYITSDPSPVNENDEDVKIINADNNDTLKATIDDIEASTTYHVTYLVSQYPNTIFDIIKSLFKPVEAAGGIVWNPQGAILLIFRHGKWDLPKGKIENGEATDEAAIREVSEECGVQELTVNSFYGTSYHTYWQHNQRMLKITYWYDMSCFDPENINPQTEEGIETIRWMDNQGLNRAIENTFPNLFPILKSYSEKVPF
jgi:8-oxo-dGTP pyrophosphatase MutT (NUDIX family)